MSLSSTLHVARPAPFPPFLSPVPAGVTAPGIPVPFATFRRDIIERGGARAIETYRRWMSKSADLAFLPIQDFVHGIDHRVLHSLLPADVDRVTSHPDPGVRTEHALSDIRFSDPWVVGTRRFSTPWALAFLMHEHLERTGRIPRWGEFLGLLRGEAFGLYYGPYRTFCGHDALAPAEYDEGAALRDRGFLYRAGAFYYSFLRELDLMARLRSEYSLPVRYHLLADVEFRFDFWCGNVIVLIFVGSGYRPAEEGGVGSKKDPADLLDIRGFSEVRAVLPKVTGGLSGRVALFGPRQVAAIAAEIRSKMDDTA